ncbi:RNA-binding transcriptional accessory protein [Deltaproteobacteria bacterium Smac51]|nr:RNA-binding transcriptional accessory protein [Deltaproteobacteria bacterium Smac51]
MNQYFDQIAQELNVKTWQVEACAALLAEDATVPFIARYRKEATGTLDEVAVTAVRDRLAALAELDARREAIIKSLTERELLTDELKEKVLAAETMATLEDIYLPYRPKRRTRATIAKEKGLEPLALTLMEQNPGDAPEALAVAFIDTEKGVADAAEALAGARDIVAEMVSEDAGAREKLRTLFEEEGRIESRVVSGQEESGAKFRDYFEWDEPIKNVPSHRLLAMRRGETEGFLSLSMRPAEESAIAILEKIFLKNDSAAAGEIKAAITDGYKRLLSLSMETEVRLLSKKKADLEAIGVFAKNLTELLLASPLGSKPILAIDPGFRTGCKLVALSAEGTLLEYETIQPHTSEGARGAAAQVVMRFVQKHKPAVVAVGNGTAGRETEAFVRDIPGWPGLPVVMVNESGASIYSASEVARQEFPDLDLTIRGAISIGRRLMDPLAELVKIDPKSIGVGQYQHDVNQTDLKRSLDDVVISCVNKVGVEPNTASEQLLTYVSGLGPSLAKNIIKFRGENGPFRSRRDFLKVPRLGPKAFEQSAGFLRLQEAENPLDGSAVHPESYPIVEKMAADLGASIADLLNKPELRAKIKLSEYVTDKVGLPTLTDIMAELEKPGRDPREEFKAFAFAEGIDKMEDLSPGMKLPGIVTNVTAFGAFVDVGVHQDGLVHISELADTFVKDASAVVKVHQQVTVTVLEVDLPRKRLALSMKSNPGQGGRRSAPPEGGESTGGGRQRPGGGPRRDGGKSKKPEPQPFNNPFAALKK